MARGIAGDRIFQNDLDRDDFLNRLGALTKETETRCLAWALMANHFHLGQGYEFGNAPLAIRDLPGIIELIAKSSYGAVL
jgi:hypothetical protein